MKILIAGSNGMVGSAATHHLIESGHEVVRLVRHTPSPGEVWWNPDAGEIDKAGLEGFEILKDLRAQGLIQEILSHQSLETLDEAV